MRKLDYLQQKKLSPADELREILGSLEERLLKVKLMTSSQALMLIHDLDRLFSLFSQLEATDLNLLPERGRFESVQARLKKTAGALLKAVGGPQALNRARSQPAPPREQWWWYIHEIVAQQQQRFRRQLVIGTAVILLVLGGLALAFKTILAPSPEVVARVEAENQAYTAVDAADYQAALLAIETGLAKVPGDAGLLIFKGVLQESLGDEAGATQSFAQAQAALDDPQTFYFSRGQLELRVNRLDQAESNARAAIALDENSPNAWLLLGQTLEFQNRKSEAIPAYERASRLAFDQGDNEVVVLARLALGRITMAP